MDYRIHVPRMAYRGSDKRKLEKKRRDSQLCAEIEVILQREYDAIKPGEIRAILSHSVAHEMGADSEQVRRIICRVQGGSNGVTFSKPLPGEPWAHDRPPADRPSDDQGASDDLSSDGKFKLGDRARHEKFGEGLIIAIQADQITVEFDGSGTKRIMSTFLHPLHG